ncbi:DUF1127 domain-containing protein [Serratia sp. D1N4]
MDNLLEEPRESQQNKAARIRKCGAWLLLRWRAWWNRYTTRKVLAAMSDAQLRDIGLRRSDVEREGSHRNYEHRPW